jgi:phage terminase small subunit
MPRHRLPPSTAEASGAIERNPQRYRDRLNPPTVDDPIGEPPNHFDDISRDLWREVVAMPAHGVLTSADRVLVEITVRLLRKLRRGERENGPITGIEVGHLRACLGSMGCTPADRSKVSGADEPQKEEDELAGFVQ